MVFGFEHTVSDLRDTQGRIVVLFQDQRVFLRQFTDLVQRWRLLMTGHPEVVVGDHVLRHHIGTLLVFERQGMDEVSLALLEGLCTLVPLLHHKAVRNLQTGQDEVEHLHIITVGLTSIITELIGRELPVADNGQRVVFRIFPDKQCLCWLYMTERQQTGRNEDI